MSFYAAFCIEITNNTSEMAEIQEIHLDCEGWWRPRLPCLLCGQGGAAFGEVHNILHVKKCPMLIHMQAYNYDSIRGSFVLCLPTVRFVCRFTYNYECGAHFHYEREGSDVNNYVFTPKPVAVSHGTTATVSINIVDPQ